jgi:hypothetical protein
MKKTIPLLIFLSIIIFTACNNSSGDKENANDTANKMMPNDTMDHAHVITSTVPELPTIPEGAKVYFKNLKNDQVVSSPFTVKMGVDGIKIDTAGPVVQGSGHHHMFINAEDSLVAGTIVPTDSSHIHFGRGQTEYELKLSPGRYKLTLQFADGLHRAYGGKLSSTVTINVK